MKNITLALFAIILMTLNLAFAQVEPKLGINIVPMLTITGNPGERFEIQYSTDLGQTDPWKVLSTVSIYNQPVTYFDATAVDQPKRFYRMFKIPSAESLVLSNGNADINFPTMIIVDQHNTTDGVRVYSAILKAVGSNITVQNITVSFENGETTTDELQDMIDSVGVYSGSTLIAEESFSGSPINFSNLDAVELVPENPKELFFSVNLKNQIGNYNNGSSFFVSGITINYTNQYGNPGTVSGVPQGGLKVLRVNGAIFEFISSSSVRIDQSVGDYSILFKLTAINEDLYIPISGESVSCEILNQAGEVLVIPVTEFLERISGGQVTNGQFMIPNGSTASFRFRALVDNTSQPSMQMTKVRLKNVGCRIGSTIAPIDEASVMIPNNIETALLLLDNIRYN